MTPSLLMNKFPIYSVEIPKSDIKAKNVDEIIDFLKQKIETDEVAVFIAVFDHYTHTSSLNGTITPQIKDAKNLIFCFGVQIPNAQVLAVRPRSIGVCELDEMFSISFMEPPKEEYIKVMESWIDELKI